MAFMREVERQNREIEKTVRTEGERLGSELKDLNKCQAFAVMRAMNHRVEEILNLKDRELANAKQMSARLVARVFNAQRELAEWKRRTKSSSTVIKALRHEEEQQAEAQMLAINKADDAQSACSGGGSAAAGSCDRYTCRVCGEELACMILMPCRHLCCCEACDAGAARCPICGCKKFKSVAVNMA